MSKLLQKHQSTSAANSAATQCGATPIPRVTQQRCKGIVDSDDKLSTKASETHKKVLSNPDATKDCKKRAQDILTMTGRFNRYRKALPAARAANELNKLGNEKDSQTNKNKRNQKCITMLPVDDAKKLNIELCLPPGTITDKMLRNDKTGFRAAIFRDESTGKLILAGRDTQPDSLVDWMTNTRNGQGIDTPQYQDMRDLTKVLVTENVSFDIAGYSKGGGLAQEAGLIAKNAEVYVFNGAGLHENSLARTGGGKNFDQLSARTHSFSAEGEFLTFMNNTTDGQQQLYNAEFLRKELAGEGRGVNPMKLKYRNPKMKLADKAKSWFAPDPDPDFKKDRIAYLAELDNMIEGHRKQFDAGKPITIFPPVRAGHHETVVNSGNWVPGLEGNNPNLARMAQHLMPRVLNPMEKSVQADRLLLNNFVDYCGR